MAQSFMDSVVPDDCSLPENVSTKNAFMKMLESMRLGLINGDLARRPLRRNCINIEYDEQATRFGPAGFGGSLKCY